jgi:hypothetical protein
MNFNYNATAYSGVQKGPALPRFFNDKNILDAYSCTRERWSGSRRFLNRGPLKTSAQLYNGMMDSAETES